MDRDDATQKVTPTAGSSGRRRLSWARLSGLLVSLLLLLCGFELVSSLAGLASASQAWMLGAGLSATLVAPLLLGLWLRRRNGRRRRQPSSALAVGLWNLLLVAGLGLAVPETCRRAEQAHGSWWVARLVGARAASEEPHIVLRGSRRLFGALVELLPAEPRSSATQPGTPSVASPGDAGAAGSRTDSGLPVADSVVTVADSVVTAAADAASVGGKVQVDFERRGSSILVPVTIRGPAAEVRAKMIFDTGATLTTIDRATVDRLGLVVDPRDPMIVTETANGKARRTVKVVESIVLSGARVEGGLAVTVCDPCAVGGAVGLLGLNFSRHFEVTFDHEAGRLQLGPRRERLSQLYDIRSFVELEGGRGLRRGPQMTVELTLNNRAPRELRNVRVAAVVEGGKDKGRIWTEVPSVPPRSSVPVTIKGLLAEGTGNRFRLELEHAAW